MRSALQRATLGVVAAIAITTAMDATGLSAFSALPLFPLMGLLWYLEKHSRQDIGLVGGRPLGYGLAILYPTLVLGAVGGISAASGALDAAQIDWSGAWRKVAIVSAATVVVALITEEGFFRGWLFASLRRAGLNGSATLVVSSLAFSLWHLSAVTLSTGFDLPAAQIPVFMFNAVVLGLIWGLLRAISGSILVSSVSHGLWNGGAYVFFGYGTTAGALGIHDTPIYGPEVGILGLGLNLLFAAALWGWTMRSSAKGSAPLEQPPVAQ
jgi:membrane protease YdiL (CAAX protease family)